MLCFVQAVPFHDCNVFMPKASSSQNLALYLALMRGGRGT